jgi:hypothetical protein
MIIVQIHNKLSNGHGIKVHFEGLMRFVCWAKNFPHTSHIWGVFPSVWHEVFLPSTQMLEWSWTNMTLKTYIILSSSSSWNFTWLVSSFGIKSSMSNHICPMGKELSAHHTWKISLQYVIMWVFKWLLTLKVLKQITQSYCTLMSALLCLALCKCWPVRKSFSLWDFKWQSKLLWHLKFTPHTSCSNSFPLEWDIRCLTK